MSNKNRKSKKRSVFLVFAAIIFIALILVAYNKFEPNNSVAPVTHLSTSGQTTKGENPLATTTPPTSVTQNSSPTTTQQSTSKVNNSGSATSLITPSGDFVSDHHPNLSGTPDPNLEESVCNTTPSATCQISFTMNGTTKSLEAGSADSGGAVYWSWHLQDLSLTAGSWTVTATATLNGQSSTATDPQQLVVSP
jgi:hypothetical protein